MSDVSLRLQASPAPARPAAARAAWPGRAPAWTGGRALAIGGLTLAVGLWLLTHGYTGIRIDARIYLGRAVADLLPSTVGQDLMFRQDGQAPFSLFTPLLRALVRLVGPQEAGLWTAAAAVVAWLAAATALSGRLAQGSLAAGRLRWAMLACAAVLPCDYGGLLAIPFGEAQAVPRPFAEAATLAALALALGGRRWSAFGLLCLGALLHPLMPLAGFAALFLMLAADDRRWWLAAPLATAAAALAVTLHAPLFGRLLVRADPAWLQLLRWRNPYLFPSLWTAATWSQSAVQLCTVALAAVLVQGRARLLMAAAIGVALAGVAAAWLLGEVFPSVLVLQLQPWRALWLTAVLASLCAPLVAVRLLAEGPCARLALALMAAAWLVAQSPAAPALGLCALALVVLARTSRASVVGEGAARLAWGVVALLALGRAALAVGLTPQCLQALPRGARALDAVLLASGLPMLLVPPLAVWAARPHAPATERRMARWAPVLGLALLAWAALRWDRVPARVEPGPGGDAALQRMIASRPGEVEWIDGDTQAWMLAGRAFWGSEIQGASIVFSRDQALAWATRMRQLRALGLAPANILQPWKNDDRFEVIRPTAGQIAGLCRLPDGPAWVVAPLIDDAAPPALAGVKLWRAARPAYLREGRFTWRTVQRYAVVDCAAAVAGLTPPYAARPPGPPRQG